MSWSSSRSSQRIPSANGGPLLIRSLAQSSPGPGPGFISPISVLLLLPTHLSPKGLTSHPALDHGHADLLSRRKSTIQQPHVFPLLDCWIRRPASTPSSRQRYSNLQQRCRHGHNRDHGGARTRARHLAAAEADRGSRKSWLSCHLPASASSRSVFFLTSVRTWDRDIVCFAPGTAILFVGHPLGGKREVVNARGEGEPLR